MKVLHIITTIERGGAEKQLLTLASSQVQNNKEVSVLYLKGASELTDDFVGKGVKVVGIFANKHPVVQVIKIRKYLRKNKDFIVHAHLPRAELLCSLAISGRKFLFSRHNAEQFFPRAPVWLSSFLSRRVSRRAFCGIMISNAVREFCLENNEISRKCRIVVIHYGIVPHSINWQSPRTLNAEQSVHFGSISRLVPQKDIPTLLLGFSKHLRDFPKDVLSIVGNGPLAADLHNLCESLNISKQVTWKGRLENVDEFYRSLDVFVLSSLYEGFGLVLLEAMCFGLPIIATDISAIPEVLGDGTGILYKPGDSTELSKKMREIRGNEIRSQYSQKSCERVKLFTDSQMEKAIEKIMNQLMSTK